VPGHTNASEQADWQSAAGCQPRWQSAPHGRGVV